MTLPASVVIVSLGRPGSLMRTLEAVSRLYHDCYEIVVVSDQAGLEAVGRKGLETRVKTVAFTQSNIAAARNAGINASGGKIIAFLDDDAQPEPSWLTHLSAAFEDPDTTSAGGYVIGRNGISYQYRARHIDHHGQTHAMETSPECLTVFPADRNCIVKTEGTNMAFRRETLVRLGGFDEAYRFYLDESDLNMRVAQVQHRVALCPLALVHHNFAASERRHQNRVPRDLYEQGASLSVFLRKFCPSGEGDAAKLAYREEIHHSLMRHLRKKRLKLAEMRHLMERLGQGLCEGETRAVQKHPGLCAKGQAFHRFPTRATGAHVVISGRFWQASALRLQAKEAAAEGATVSLYLFSPSALYHHVSFTDDGYWLQTGGIFGRSRRTQPLIRLTGFNSRVHEETTRVALVRQKN